MNRLHRALTRLLGWSAGVFKHVERIGGPIPEGPVLVVANHPNSLLDPLVIFRTAGRSTRPMAKAPLFDQPGVGLVLRALGGLPVYRRRDDPALMDRNEDTFRDAIAALHAGQALQIFPEGVSHSEPSLQPLRTGAARIALQAEADADWRLGLRIVPVGLTYSRKTLFRGRTAVAIGEPLSSGDYRAPYEIDPVEAVRTLTGDIARRLEALTLNFAEADDADLIDTAERLYAREKGWSGWRERESLAERLPRLRVFAKALAWLRAHDPARHARLERAVRRHQRRLVLLRAGDADVPPRFTPGAVLEYALRETLLLALTLPLGLLGILLWALPYQITRMALRRFPPPKEDVVATYKLLAAMVLYPLFYAGWTAVAYFFGGALTAGMAAVALLPLGFLAIFWMSRWERVVEDTRLFLKLAPNRRRRDRISAERRQLVAEFDAIRDEMAERE
jgi:1-acyl-sn-glycerol-3-phosphate acyltransferase